MRKLIVPIPYYRLGGVERVIVSVLEELVTEIEQIILVLPKKDIEHFQKILPNSPVITYESLEWSGSSFEYQIISFLNRLMSWFGKIRAEEVKELLKETRRRYKEDYRIRYLVNEYEATYCLYFLANRLVPPNLKIPLAMVAHDVFWRFSPLTYEESYIKEYDLSLLEWLKKADVVFSVSKKTYHDIISIFPTFSHKIVTIPNSGFPTKSNLSQKPIKSASNNSVESKNQKIIFYYPSSFGIYKDHLTLLQAGLKLARKNLKFKIVLIGKETDNLVTGKISLSQQASSKEYINYLNQCKQIYQDNQVLIEEYFQGLGYCEDELLEQWYHQCSCVVVPSRYEGFGLAVSEAIVRGLPVIASDLEVFREQVELYRCSDLVDFFPISDVDALAERMENFILNPKRKLSGTESNDRFSRWTWKQVAQQYIDSLEKLHK